MAIQVEFQDDFGNKYPEAYAMLGAFGSNRMQRGLALQFLIYPTAEWRQKNPQRALGVIDLNATADAADELLKILDEAGRSALYKYAKSVNALLASGKDC